MRDLIEYDETVECDNPLCVYGKATVVTGLHGVIGGGLGPYTTCSLCGTVLTKSFDKDLCDSHDDPEELKARKDEAIEQGTEILGHTDLMVSPEAIDEATENVDVEDNQAGGDIDNKRTGGTLSSPRK